MCYSVYSVYLLVILLEFQSVNEKGLREGKLNFVVDVF